MTIEVTVAPAVGGGLRIIDHIPVVRPCLLEGRNGIGKSSLIRLLLLASGHQPYIGDPRAWASLKRLLGPTTLTVSGLVGPAAQAQVTFTPERWPDEPVEQIGDWVGKVTLDGQPATASDLFAMLDVVHISGTDKLQSVLSMQFPRLAVALHQMMRQLRQLDTVRAQFGEVADQLEGCSPTRAHSDTDRLRQAGEERRQLAQQIPGLRKRAEDLSRAATLQAVLASGDAEEQARQLTDLRQRRAEAEEQVRDAEAQHEAATSALDSGSAIQKNSARLERKLRSLSRQRDDILSQQGALADVLRSVGVAPDAQSLTAAELRRVHERSEAARQQRTTERVKAARQVRTSEQNAVLDDLRVVLSDAAGRNMGELVIAHVGGHEITVSELLATLGDVATDTVSAAPQDSEPDEWTALEELFEQKGSILAAIGQTTTELHDLAPDLAEHDILRGNAETARAALEAATERLHSLTMQIGEATQSGLGGIDIEDARAQVAELTSTYGVTTQQLSETVTAAHAELQAATQQETEVNRLIEELNAESTRRRLLRETVRRRAATDPAYAWIPPIVEHITGLEADDSAEWGEEVWQALADHAASVRASLQALTNQIEGLAVSAQNEAQEGIYAPALRAVIEQDILQEISARPIVEALFDDGEVEQLNFEEQTVTWTMPTGERRTRPLSVFSSGEQALGFIRARLQQAAALPSLNRMIFLDEFGAFIAADRRRPLAGLLHGSELGDLSSQAIVVLPLQADYESDKDETTGELHELYKNRAAQIAERGYFAEEFTQ